MRLKFFGMVVFGMLISTLGFAEVCPSVKQIEKDFPQLKVHQFVKIKNRPGWEAMKDHLARHEHGFLFEYVQINTDAPKHDGVKCLYSTNKGTDISIVYHKFGDFVPASSNWKETVDEGGPMCGDFKKSVDDPSACVFKVRK